MSHEKLYKEIDLIQTCIARMANNSFLIKGWLLTLIAVVSALLGENIELYVLSLILVVPLICFWFLDAYYLRCEQKYRKLYVWVIENRIKNNNEFLYDLNPQRFENDVNSIIKILFSTTLLFFYGIPFLGILITFVVSFIAGLQ